MLKSILLELVRKNSALSQIIYKYEIQNIAYPRELNWNMHLYTKLTFSSRPEWEKNWNRIRKQETGDFFSPLVLQSICHIYKKKTYHIKIKKTNKQNKETDILENKKRGTEKDRHVHAITEELSHNLRRVCPWIQLLWILLRIPAPGHWRDRVSLLFLLLLGYIQQLTDLILVSFSTKRIGVLVLPPGWVASPS